jgi:hypothetical protein
MNDGREENKRSDWVEGVNLHAVGKLVEHARNLLVVVFFQRFGNRGLGAGCCSRRGGSGANGSKPKQKKEQGPGERLHYRRVAVRLSDAIL